MLKFNIIIGYLKNDNHRQQQQKLGSIACTTAFYSWFWCKISYGANKMETKKNIIIHP